VKKGGRLIVQGDRISHAAGDWPEWFDLNWNGSRVIIAGRFMP